MENWNLREDILVDDLLKDLRLQLGPQTDAASLQRALAAVAARYCPPPLASCAPAAASVPAAPAAQSAPFSPFSSAATEAASILSTLQGEDLALLRSIVHYLPVAVSWFDADLNMLACNRQYQQLLDFPDALFASNMPNYEDFIRYNAERGEYGPGDVAEITRKIVAQAKSGQPHVLERLRPDGTVLEIRGTPLPCGGFVTLYTDITAHKRAEQAAVRNSTYLKAVIAQLPQGLTVIDENLDIVLWNRLWESSCGAQPGFLYDGVTFEIAVRHLAEMGEYGGGDAAAIEEQVQMRVGLAKQFMPHCFRRTRANGRVIEIEGRTMEIEGKVAGFITMYNDITDRLAIDDLKQAKETAESSNRMKSEFLALISHEIRTPLAGVIGMLKLALRDMHLQGETRQLIERGQDSALSLLTIINDLLDFSKIEAGKLSLENIVFALADTVQDVMLMFNAQATSKGLAFSAQIDTAMPPYVVGDPVRLRQVLVNLIGNAFKFTLQGHILVRLELLPPGCAAAGDEGNEGDDGDAGNETGQISKIRFSVEDSGIGIPQEAVGRIFEKFEQADDATTRRFGGTGLGLAICRQLVELMGGTIGVTSQAGQGSIFYFELPMAEGAACQAHSQHADIALQAHSHQLQVLCADDFKTNQIIIRMLVEEMGHEVALVDCGEEAVAACARQHFDVILMDGRMPDMDGVTACQLIRNGGRPGAPVHDKDIYIIAVTANAGEEDRKHYLNAGMDNFLPKPIDEANLHRQLAKVIERQLQRGIALPSRALASGSELDAMFGVHLAAPPVAAVPPAVQAQVPVPAAMRSIGPAAAPAAHDILGQMRHVFVEDVCEKLVLLEQAMAAKHADESGRLLHSMRGSAVYLEHTDALQLLCTQLEPQADAGNWALLEKSLPQLRQLVANCQNT